LSSCVTCAVSCGFAHEKVDPETAAPDEDHDEKRGYDQYGGDLDRREHREHGTPRDDAETPVRVERT
jgi:hypothetical protein